MPRKQVGTVTFLDDLPEDALGLQTSQRARDAKDDGNLAQMTSTELEALALTEAMSGQQSTSRALAVAIETRAVGLNTARELQQQTEQLERLTVGIGEVSNTLDKSDFIIDKMSRGKLSRMVRKKKSDGKKPPTARAERRHLAEREALKTHGLSSVDLNGIGGDHEEASPNRELLLAGNDVRKSHMVEKSRKVQTQQSARSTQEDYSHYSSGVAHAIQQQDSELDAISVVLNDLRSVAGAMGGELQYHNVLITNAVDDVGPAIPRIADQNNRIKRIR
jgi:hypothetical protein